MTSKNNGQILNKLAASIKDPGFIREVFAFAEQKYGSAKRQNFDESYIEHVFNVAEILAGMNVDETTIAAGILHDIADLHNTAENKREALGELEKKFGKDIAALVERNAELQRIYYSFHAGRKENVLTPAKAETIRRMFLAIARDLRVVLIDLASRIDGLGKISNLSPEMQKIYATETLEIFVPIANRLGLGEIKRKLEDPAFAVLYSEKYAWLQEHLKEKYEERQKYLKRFIPKLKKILRHEHIDFLDIHFRPKSYWSAYQKLERHQMNFEKLHDLVAIRLIVKDVAACYRTLGILHKHFSPMSGHIQDYIAKSKENGYKSLHTTVFLDNDHISEIQIKTDQMHKEAEYGVCAHWVYKEKRADKETISWSKEIPELLKTFKIDFFENQIFAFTPKGDIISLPKGATPVDFAYAVHSDIGNHCESAKIHGKIIPLSQELRNGDVVEIITNKNRKPSYDWLAFVKTGFAKNHIKKLAAAIINPIFFVPSYVKQKIFGPRKNLPSVISSPKSKKSEIYLAGQKGVAITMAKCCNPKPGDAAKAYLTKYRAAMLHKVSCDNFQKVSQKYPEKIIEASWEQS